MNAYKFLAEGAVAPFTSFRWPRPGLWVGAPAGRADAWVHACRTRDLPYWLDDELWRIQLDDPVRKTRYQVASPRARLVARIAEWNPAFGIEYGRACVLRARDLALPHLPPPLRDALAGLDDVPAIAAAVQRAGSASRAAEYLGDASSALRFGPAPVSYIACTLASTTGGGLAAFEAERAWQARWLAERLGLA